MWRDRILAWGIGLSAVLLPGCLSDRPRLTPKAQEQFDQAGQQEARGVAESSGGSPYHPQGLRPNLQQPSLSVQASTEPPPYPKATENGPTTQTASAAAPTRPTPTPRTSGAEIQAVVHEDVRPAPVKPRPPEEPSLLAALRCYREGRKDEARKHLQKFDPSTREVLERLLLLAVRISNVNLDMVPPRELSVFLQQFDVLAQLIRPRAGLEITEVRFCQRIRRFGDYDPLPADHTFQAGAGDRPGDFVQVYVELRNFTCCKHGPFYETALASSVTIRDPNQQIVCRVGRPAQVDRLLSRRLDCFLNCHFYVPPGLPPGEYQLTIEVKDVTGLPDAARVPAQHVAKQVVPFRVSSPVYASGTWENADSVGSE